MQKTKIILTLSLILPLLSCGGTKGSSNTLGIGVGKPNPGSTPEPLKKLDDPVELPQDKQDELAKDYKDGNSLVGLLREALQTGNLGKFNNVLFTLQDDNLIKYGQKVEAEIDGKNMMDLLIEYYPGKAGNITKENLEKLIIDVLRFYDVTDGAMALDRVIECAIKIDNGAFIDFMYAVAKDKIKKIKDIGQYIINADSSSQAKRKAFLSFVRNGEENITKDIEGKTALGEYVFLNSASLVDVEDKHNYRFALLAAASIDDLEFIQAFAAGQKAIFDEVAKTQNKIGNTVFHIFATVNEDKIDQRWDCFLTIFENITDIRILTINNNGYENFLLYAIKKQNEKFLKKLFSLGGECKDKTATIINVKQMSEDLYTPINLALTFKNSREIVKLLIDNGADFYIQDGYGNNALHMVVISCSPGYENLSIKDGIALIAAMREKNSEMYNRALKTHNHNHKTPIDLADEKKQPEIKKELEKLASSTK